jgi:hypothetical protein
MPLSPEAVAKKGLRQCFNASVLMKTVAKKLDLMLKESLFSSSLMLRQIKLEFLSLARRFITYL